MKSHLMIDNNNNGVNPICPVYNINRQYHVSSREHKKYLSFPAKHKNSE